MASSSCSCSNPLLGFQNPINPKPEKNFLNWFQLKPKINTDKQRPIFQEREVWMCQLGTNVGFKLDGKKSECLRSVIVFKKLSKETFLAIPILSG